MKMTNTSVFLLVALPVLFLSFDDVRAQSSVSLKSRIDAHELIVGDQAKLFIEATVFDKNTNIGWAAIPDTFNHLEVVEKGKIDTVHEGAHVTYKQRLLITGFDSGSFRVPAFAFRVMPPGGGAYTLYSDSFRLNVSTVAVDTTKPFRPIKTVMEVKTTWRDYLWLIIGGIIFLALAAFVIIYFIRNKKTAIPAMIPKAPPEGLEQKTLRRLAEIEQQQLWQSDRVKEYYTALTDVLRSYIEDRFRIPAMEQTTDELLSQARRHPEINKHYEQLAKILTTADLAKFAKAKPLPQEHTLCMEEAREFVRNSREIIKDITTPTQS